MLSDELTSQKNEMVKVRKSEGVWEHYNLSFLFAKLIDIISQIS